MRTLTKFSLGLIATFAYTTALVQPVLAHDLDLVVQKKGGEPGPPPKDSKDGKESDDGGGSGDTTRTAKYYDWMHSDLPVAWNLYNEDGLYKGSYLGQNVTITVVDDFNGWYGYWGDLENSISQQLRRHGEWTLLEASLIAPSATMVADEFTRGGGVKLASGFNVLNLSYGVYAATGYNVDQLLFGRQEESIISYAWNGDAVISKAAGNDRTGVGTGVPEGELNAGLEDYLATALIGAQSAIFVGALDSNGTVKGEIGTGTLAWYSNTAGLAVDQYLVVGVDGDLTGLYGTSFAAPIISGYAAILSSKFDGSSPDYPAATPTQIANQLLDTARMDTLVDLGDLNSFYYGQGEASIFRALSPMNIDGFGEYMGD